MTRTIKLIPKKVKRNMHFKIFGIKGKKECEKHELNKLGGNELKQRKGDKNKKLTCTPQEHGDFGDLPFWRPEIWR